MAGSPKGGGLEAEQRGCTKQSHLSSIGGAISIDQMSTLFSANTRRDPHEYTPFVFVLGFLSNVGLYI